MLALMTALAVAAAPVHGSTSDEAPGSYVEDHLSTLGLELPDVPPPGSKDVSTTLLAFFERVGQEPSAQALEAIQALATLPEHQSDAIAAVAAAQIGTDAAMQALLLDAATTGATPEPAAYLPALAARAHLVEAALDLASAFPEPLAVAAGGFDPADPVQVDLGCSNNVYTQDYALVIDVCGDDTYRNNAGGTFQIDGTLSNCAYTLDLGVSHVAVVASAALIDLDGNDVYDATDPADIEANSCGVNGGGVFGSGFLFDAAGADTYRAGNVGVNGGGHFGIGLLLDQAGGDSYTAADQGANGGAYVTGHGALIDLDGDDTYDAGTATRGVNGGGYMAGVGLVVDIGTLETFVDNEVFTCHATEVCTQSPDPLDPFAFDAQGTRINA